MIKKILYRVCSSLTALVVFVITGYSQVESTDTITTVIQEANTAPADEYQSTVDDETTSYYADTLKQDFRSIIYDSIEAINADKGFYYKRYLDSLLRATQVKQERRPPRQVDFNGGSFFNSIFGIILWILAIGLFGYLVYRLFLSNSAVFSRNRRNISSDVIVTAEEDTGDADALLRNAIRAGNYRLAVRYLYLQLLDKLAERKYIEINLNKTNYEYVIEVRRHKFANEFASLTLKYEYVWYGEYPVDERLFEHLQNDFTQFNKNLTR